MIDYRVYAVTDDPSRYRGNWLDNLAAILEGGVTCVQYRDTESNRNEQYERILKLRELMKRYDAALVVNNDAELAKAVKAHGLHVGQGDMPVAEARKIVGSGVEIGLSITAAEQVAKAEGADIFGIGPVFDARKTKADAASAMGLNGLAEIVGVAALRVARHPSGLVAIGGITLDNAREVLKAGATGLAVVSAFSKVEDPFEAARSFAALYENE